MKGEMQAVSIWLKALNGVSDPLSEAARVARVHILTETLVRMDPGMRSYVRYAHDLMSEAIEKDRESRGN